jgi:hypothetical protein
LLNEKISNEIPEKVVKKAVFSVKTIAAKMVAVEEKGFQSRPLDSNSSFVFHRYVRWISSGSADICPFSNSKTCVSTTFTVFNPKKRFCTFSKAMAIEKMNTCADRCLIIIVRLEQCRNQDNNPDSLAYKRKLEELVDEDDLLLEEHIPSKQASLGSDSGVRALLNKQPAPVELSTLCTLLMNKLLTLRG